MVNFNRNAATTADVNDKIVAVQEVTRYMVDCMVKAGTSKSHAQQLADVLIEADMRGHYSHGLNRLGGYKGYGLGALVEIICGILADAKWGPYVRKWMTTTVIANLGQCFVAINPDGFAPNFEDRLQEFIDTMRGLKPVCFNIPQDFAGILS
ncbi:hypothetical protein X798_06136 [Onchocerca flexuosa]|uniref:Malate/L-lactate dehydrogenase n=1 Tax=Onchocerca flexuosa TaxID=387005 RepID=A0A238BN86_9BILA|nr:hypothetical protein X798_06136 [Onchocerca flexuosa]